MSVYVSGYSDDLIEIEGDLYEEFYYTDDDPYYLGFSDGTLLKITYDGDWNIRVVHSGTGGVVVESAHENNTLLNSAPDYSDVAVVHGTVEWVVGGTDVIK